MSDTKVSIDKVGNGFVVNYHSDHGDVIERLPITHSDLPYIQHKYNVSIPSSWMPSNPSLPKSGGPGTEG